MLHLGGAIARGTAAGLRRGAGGHADEADERASVLWIVYGRCCSTRHQTHFETRFIESDGML